MTAARKCKPHRWTLPAVGAAGLRCERCGKLIPWEDLDPWKTRNIVGSAIRSGADGPEFGAAMLEAFTRDGGAAGRWRDGINRRR